MALKIAVLASGVTQREIAHDTNIGEVRFSQIVNCKGVPVSEDEKRAIADRLGAPINALFAAAIPSTNDNTDHFPAAVNS